MIDGCQFTLHLPNPNTHIVGLPCWEIEVNESTRMKVNDNRKATLRGLNMKLKPSQNGGFIFFIDGSLHKYHNLGLHNTDQFTFEKVSQSIDSLSDVFAINPKDCGIHGLEIGVNITLPYSPLRILKNLVCYQSNPFTQINKRNAKKGMICHMTQYSVKLYDKQEVSGVDCGNTLRIEAHIDKMKAIEKYNIRTLEDLRSKEKVLPLVSVLLNALSCITWTDTSVNLNRLSNREQKQWLYFSNPRTWKLLGKDKRKRAKKTWNVLLNKYGDPPNLVPLVMETWEKLFHYDLEAEQPPPFYQLPINNEASKNATILPLECSVKMEHNNFKFNNKENTSFNMRSNDPKKCLSCNKDISNQKRSSRFCSERLYGKKAKKCKNKDSNNRRDKRRKIATAMELNRYLSITYYNSEGQLFTDILHPSEIHLSRVWIDRIKEISMNK